MADFFSARVHIFWCDYTDMTKRDPFNFEKNLEERDELELRRKIVRDRIKDLLDQVMATKGGRELIHNILEITQINTCSFNTNALSMSFSEGRRSVGLDIQGLIKPDSYLLMIGESNERRKQSKRI